MRILSHQMLSLSLLLITSACTKSNTENSEAHQPPETEEFHKTNNIDDIKSTVLTAKNADIDNAPWGQFLKYSEGTTYGTKDSLTGVAEINPGQQIHPPHVHAEEEYLMVLEGEGTWHLNGKDFPAKAGDMLYSRPWEIHGIKNTGETMLKFVVWKWNSKGVPVIENPEGKTVD